MHQIPFLYPVVSILLHGICGEKADKNMNYFLLQTTVIFLPGKIDDNKYDDMFSLRTPPFRGNECTS